ncbi:MAG TPA: LysR family transcriptional regulator [Candidatus Dormibacteraeota bacterium]|nr:LysR family transcriptional regulator [Candidatus Dormibacteraeota bacterium]
MSRIGGYYDPRMPTGKLSNVARSDARKVRGPTIAFRDPSASIGSLDLKQIRCFVAAYEEGSFRRAAVREHCTQPGLSVCIQRLESTVAHRLFDRKARGVTPTVAGKHFYASCVDVLKTVVQARQGMMDMAGSVPASINIGVSPTMFKGVLPWVLPDYLSAHPEVDVRLAEAYSGTLTDWVLSGETDLAIVTKPPVHLGLETTHFCRDRLVLVRRPDRGSRKGRRALGCHLSELANLKLVLPSQRHSLRQVIEAGVRLGTAASGRVLEIDGMLGTLELVRTSDWATVVAGLAVMDEVKQGRLMAEPIYGPELWIDFYLIRTKDTLLSVACRDFLHRMQEILEWLSNVQNPIPAPERLPQVTV